MEDFVRFAIIVAVGAVLLWYDFTVFALYAFAATIGLIIFLTGRLWKYITVNLSFTNLKILAIVQKVGVSEADLKKLAEAELAKMSPRERKVLESYYRSLRG